MAYQPLEVSTLKPVEPTQLDPRFGYWMYSAQPSVVEMPVQPPEEGSSVPLKQGWNVIRGVARNVQLGPEVYPTWYSGRLGNFQPVQVGAETPLDQDKLYWVFTSKDTVIAPPQQETAAEQAVPANAVAGRVLDDQGTPVKWARIRVTSADGRTSQTSTDGWGQFQLPPGPAPFRLRISATYFRPVDVNVDGARPYTVQLRRLNSQINLRMYCFPYGDQKFRPQTLLVYEWGNYSRRYYQTFYDLGWQFYDYRVPYFPQGKKFRIRATWVDQMGRTQSITRDGTADSTWEQVYLYNSWSY